MEKRVSFYQSLLKDFLNIYAFLHAEGMRGSSVGGVRPLPTGWVGVSIM